MVFSVQNRCQTASRYYIHACRWSRCSVTRSEEYYVDPLIFRHEEGHAFPSQPPRARQLYDRVAAEVWRRCGR